MSKYVWQLVQKFRECAKSPRAKSKYWQTAVNRLKTKVLWQPIGFELLDKQFSIPELHTLYETILEKDFERRNFYKRIMELGILQKVDIRRDGGRKRPADLFEFDLEKYNTLINNGLSFKI